MKRLLCATVLAIVGAIALPTTAHADEDDWSIPRYDVAADAATDGSVEVRIDFDFDFADTEGHGPYVTLPLRQEIAGDPDHYRSFDITGIRASSPSGAPADVETETESGALAIRIGDEDVEVTGRQSYQLSYRISGVVNPRTGPAGEDEIFWNIVGTEWEVPLRDVRVRLTGPAAVARSACFAGASGTAGSCDSSQNDGATATFTQGSLEPGRGLTVLAGWPAGTFVGADPVLIPRRNLGNTFTLDPLTGTLAGVLALLGVGLVAGRARAQGRDQQYVGLAPGLSPTGADIGSVVARDGRAPVAVQFSPPAGVRPGELGTLLDEVAHPHDVTATVVDLAVRGHLRIEEVEPGEAEAASKTARAWRLVKLQGGGQEELVPYEQLVLDRLFDDKDAVRLAELGGTFHATLAALQTELYKAVVERGWFSANPQQARHRWYGIGAVISLLGAGLTLLLALTVGWGLVGLAVVLVGISTLVLAHRMPARTAEGSAVLAQARGFKTYLETAEGDQLRFEEGEDLFSRYLPYAIAFGVAERWAKVFADLAAQGRPVPEPTWYVGLHSPALFSGSSSFGDSLHAFSQSATTNMTAATSGSSSGSGFSGGSVGAGVGGGGGGGW